MYASMYHSSPHISFEKQSLVWLNNDAATAPDRDVCNENIHERENERLVCDVWTTTTTTTTTVEQYKLETN